MQRDDALSPTMESDAEGDAEGDASASSLAVARETAVPEADPTAQQPTFTEVKERAGATWRAYPQRALDWARSRPLDLWLWIAVIGLGAVLRFWGLGDKPLHHDESMHAFYSLMFARNPSSYVYDPLLHGPFQFHAVGTVFGIVLALEWLGRGEWLSPALAAAGHPWVNDATARIVPAVFGVGIVALPFWLRRELGRWGALSAALLLAVSPAFVYFSRFLREDIYFNFFMFAMVVCAVRFATSRKTAWLVGLFAATVFAYATFEGIFLTFVVFGAFLVGVAGWEFAGGFAARLPANFTDRERLFFSRSGVMLLLAAIGSILALVGLNTLHTLSAYVTTNPTQSQNSTVILENNTVSVLLWASIVTALLVIGGLLWQMYYVPSQDVEDGVIPPRAVDQIDAALHAPGRWMDRLRARLDPDHQFILWSVAEITWVQWFVAIVVGWMLFAALFWVIPGGQATSWGQGFQLGIGRGVWQGLYYWMTQQEVARGGQPWYYYLMLIPLYEQLTVVFGLIGLVYALVRPTRFRLFLAWWFVGSLVLYSWAGEKMPWLTIQILLPLVLLAGLVLQVIIARLIALVQMRREHRFAWSHLRSRGPAVALTGAIGAALLFIPMAHSMWTLSQVDPANGPLEMMVYVQTTPDVDTVMAKIARADVALYGGHHQLRIAVGKEEEWPFYWYLRDYYLDQHPSEYVTFGYPPSDTNQPQQDVLLLLPSDADAFIAAHPTGYTMKRYKLRSWWDEAYKPLPCVPTPKALCPASSQWGAGVGVPNYLSYGSTPPPGAHFDLGKATNRLWRWLWLREPLGDTGGSFDFVLVVRDGVPIHL